MKKWSYVAAAMLTAASGLALTSCIDNDEPFGITEIRKATASLLESKKAAVEAEAAAKSAQVEIAKINAEIEKLRIENEKITAEANRRIAEAEAKKIEAEAEAELLRAKGENAVSEAEAAKLRAEADAKAKEADYWQAQADAIRLDAQGRYDKVRQEIAERQQKAENAQKFAEQKLAELIYAYEKDKADNLNTWNKGLWTQVEGAFQKYMSSIEEYNVANKEYLTALNGMAAIEADLVWREKGEVVVEIYKIKNQETGEWESVEHKYTIEESGFYSPKYEKKKKLLDLIAAQQRTIDLRQEKIDKLSEYEAQLEALMEKCASDEAEFDKNDWKVLLSDYQMKLETAEVDLAQARLESQVVLVDQANAYTDPGERLAEYNKFMEETSIEIPEYVIPQIPILAVLNSAWSDAQTVKYTGKSYKLIAPTWGNTKYNEVTKENLPIPSSITPSLDPFGSTPDEVIHAERMFNGWIRDFQLAMLDDNDVLWTKARINELERQLTEGDNIYTKDLANWTLAKEVYHNGQTPIVDNLPFEAELEEAIEAYNALGAKYDELKKAVDDAKAVKEEAANDLSTVKDEYTYGDAVETFIDAQLAFEKAVVEADETFKEDIAKAEAGLVEDKEDIALYVKDLYQAYNQAVLNFQQAQLDEGDVQSAKAAMEEAQKKYNDYVIPTVGEDKKPSNGAAIAQADAEAKYEKAIKKAALDKQQTVLTARATLTDAEKVYVAAGGQLLNTDPAYAPIKEAMDNYSVALKDWEDATTELEEFSKSEALKQFKILEGLYDKQLDAIGLPFWAETTIPTSAEVENYADYDGSFIEASVPAMYLNNKQVYENAKYFVKTASALAYGQLGTRYDINSNGYEFLNGSTYDWEKDEAFLIDDVTIPVINEYIRKWIIYNNRFNDNFDEDQINDFMLAQYYSMFGSFGTYNDLATKLAYANIVTENEDNNVLKTQIDLMTKARTAMLEELAKWQGEAESHWNAYVDAYDYWLDLTTQAETNVTKAQNLYDVYSSIVDQLEPIVEKLETAALGDIRKDIETLRDTTIPDLRGEIQEEAESLAIAKETLEKLEYQLGQYESDAYAKVENPFKFVVEYLEAEVARLSEKMEYCKQRYEELLQQYNDAKKSVNYPD